MKDTRTKNIGSSCTYVTGKLHVESTARLAKAPIQGGIRVSYRLENNHDLE